MPELTDIVRDDLIRDEGVSLKPYRDSVGKLTIGIGRNLDDIGIFGDEADLMLENDISHAMDDLDRHIPWWQDIKSDAKRALLNMAFNLGWPRLSTFKKMLAALEREDYEEAAKEAMDSKWARQVGARAERIRDLYLTEESWWDRVF